MSGRRDGERRPGQRVASRPPAGRRRWTEERLALLADSLPVLVAYVDASERYLFVNRAYERWFGLPGDLIVGREVEGLVGPETYRGLAPRVRAALAGEEVDFELELALRDGARRVLHELYVPHLASDGAAVGYFALGWDVTERRLGDEALRRERDFARRLLDTAPVMVVTLDARGHVRDLNRFTEEVTGYASVQVRGRAWVDAFVPPRGRERVRELLERALAGERVAGQVTPVITRDGAERLVEWHGTVLPDEDARVVLFLGQDVTERRRAEDALRRREANLRRAQEIARLGSFEVDLERPERARWSEEALRIAGLDPGQEEGGLALLLDLVHPDDRERVGASLEETLREATRFSEEFRLIRPDGTIRHIHGLAEPVGEPEGEPTALTGTLLDLTERRRLEEEVVQVQKLEAIGSLASGIAHEYNNLLQGIDGCASIALAHLAEGAPARAYVEELRSAAERGAHLARKLLAFGRRRERTPVPVDLDAIVGSAEGMLRGLLGEEIELVVVTSGQGLRVLAAPGEAEQVLLNLAVNARDSMPSGGRLSIGTAAVEVSAGPRRPGDLPPGRYARLRVGDTGCGMDAEVRARIFEPFFTTKEVGRGTGLGLSVVYGIVSRLGGHIDVDTAPGRGTVFEVYLPLADQDAAPEPEAAARPADGGGALVLVVEDEPLVLLTTRHYLEAHGFRTLGAEDAKAALVVAEGQPIDLVLTDVALPGGSGVELVDVLRERQPGLPALFMSAYPRAVLLKDGRLRREDASLEKPFSEGALVTAVADLVAAASRAREAEPTDPGG